MKKSILPILLYLGIMLSNSSCITSFTSMMSSGDYKDVVRVHAVKNAGILPDGSLKIDFLGSIKGRKHRIDSLSITLPMQSPALSSINIKEKIALADGQIAKGSKKHYKSIQLAVGKQNEIDVKPKWKTVKTSSTSEEAPMAVSIPWQWERSNDEYKKAFLIQKDSMPKYCLQFNMGYDVIDKTIDTGITFTLYNFETFKSMNVDYGYKRVHFRFLYKLLMPLAIALDIVTFPIQLIIIIALMIAGTH